MLPSPALTQLVKEGREAPKEIKPPKKWEWSGMKNPLAQISLTTAVSSHGDLLLCLKGIFCFLEGVASFSSFPSLQPHGAHPAAWLLCWLGQAVVAATLVPQLDLTLSLLLRVRRTDSGAQGASLGWRLEIRIALHLVTNRPASSWLYVRKSTNNNQKDLC